MPFSTTIGNGVDAARPRLAKSSRAGGRSAAHLDGDAGRLSQDADEALVRAEQSLRGSLPAPYRDDASGKQTAYRNVRRSIRSGAGHLDRIVKEHPLMLLAAAIGLGVLLGLARQR
jgi:ElaB/YqjD/DUF883 family membrane-anchored ribosome-binding protein